MRGAGHGSGRGAAVVLCSALVWPAPAQAEDAGFLTRQLQDLLSGAGREVRITGFQGALSSRATIAELTIADDEGVWLTLRGAQLDWNRGALFRRALQVNALTAQEIVLERLPDAGPGAAPAPEATPFSLPEPPLSVDLGRIEAEVVQLGEAVLGQPVTLRLDGSAQLAGGAGATRLEVERTDGAEGVLRLVGRFDNASRDLEVDLALREGADGIAAGLLDLPGQPPLALTVVGDGNLADFAADIALETEGEPRLAGQVALMRMEDDAQGFRADLAGDLRPLFQPQYHDFFGPDTRLAVAGRQPAEGGVVLEEIDLLAAQLRLEGLVAVSAGGLPERIDLRGRLGAADGTPVLLPLAGPETRLGGVDLDVAFDAGTGEDWRADVVIEGLDRDGFAAERVALVGGGRIVEGPRRVDGDLRLEAAGLAPADAALAQALGDLVTAQLRIDWQEGAPLALELLEVTGSDYGLVGQATIDGQTVAGSVTAELADLARFSGLAGRPLSGRARAEIDGVAAVLDGTFDAALAVVGTDMAAGIDEVDRLLAGEARIDGRIARDFEGTALDGVRVSAQSLEARVDGVLRSAGSDLEAVLEFADLGVMGPDYGGRFLAELRLRGTDAALQRLEMDALGTDLRVGIDEVNRLLEGEARIVARASQGEGVVFLDEFRLGATTLAVTAEGRIGDAGTDLRGDLAFSDIGVLGPGWAGSLEAAVRLLEEGGARRIRLEAEGRDIAAGQPQIDGLMAGDSRLVLEALQQDGAIDVERFTLATDSGLSAEGAGRIATERSDFAGRAVLADLGVLGEGFGGRLVAEGAVADAAGVQQIRALVAASDLAVGVAEADRLFAGETRIDLSAALEAGVLSLEALRLATATGLEALASGRIAEGDIEVAAEASLADLRVLRPELGGRLGLVAAFRELDGARRLGLELEGQSLRTGIAEADTLLAGTARARLEAEQIGERLRVRGLEVSTPLLTAEADATVEGTARELQLNARLANLGALVEGLDGPATVAGTITDADANAQSYAIDLRATGPGGIDARVLGTMARDLTAALGIAGTGNLALVNRFAEPISLQGPLRFDLRLDGAPGLEALSGTVTTEGARVVGPQALVTLEGLAGTLRLGGGAVEVDARAGVQGGGGVTATGRIGLGAGLPAALRVGLQQARISDRRIFETRLSGNLSIDGPLVGGGGVISGGLSLADTEVRIPSTGLGVGGYVPPGMLHLGDSQPVRLTRARAGINGDGNGNGNGEGYVLDLTLSAPNRVFIRGRGLDAEMGGELRLTGTTRAVIPAGEFALIRGRLDILGRRFVLSEGSAQMTGRFVPALTLTATTQTAGTTASILLEGDADDLQIRFTSVPELPEEEVVALILFGRGLDTLSPFQAAQLASAVATLAGRGGDGVVANLRRGFGLDDLDVSTTEDGLAALRVGRYLTDNVYTDVVVDSEGRSEVSINLDVTSSVTVRVRTDNEGRSGLGVFFERDY
ncbi:MAG: translocation/assembly module TamB domain-containing protein [Alkalilacustris sp.]